MEECGEQYHIISDKRRDADEGERYTWKKTDCLESEEEYGMKNDLKVSFEKLKRILTGHFAEEFFDW